jgi:hypothetical protein
VPEFAFKSIFGEAAVIKDVLGLPKVLILSATFNRDTMAIGQPHRCVGYAMWRLKEGEEQPSNMPGNFKWQNEDELAAYRMMLTCLLTDLEVELKNREEYVKVVGDEIAGLTGADSAAGPTGKDS